MPLFHIQDSDRPAWVIADSYGKAVEAWSKEVAAENDCAVIEPPHGVQYVCDDTDIIVNGSFLE